MLDWPATQLYASPWLCALRPILTDLAWTAFPDINAWNKLPMKHMVCTQGGVKIHFIDPTDLTADNYEQRIAETGAIATRPNNWHDTFNALCWLAWPRTKAALNALHLRELARQSGSLRSRVRDAATLFDESGLVLAVADTSLSEALLAHDWQTLFVTNRGLWQKRITPFTFGHALMEKSLAPFIGIVAKVLVVPVCETWFNHSLSDQISQLDQKLADLISAGQLQDPRALPPMPVLGIPGWWPTQDAAFYADQRHFRPKRCVTHPR